MVKLLGKVLLIMFPNFENVEGSYWFRIVRASVGPWIHSSHVLMHVISYEQCMLGIEISYMDSL